MDSTPPKETEDSSNTYEEPMDVSVENAVTMEDNCSGTSAENIIEKDVDSITNSAEDETSSSSSNHDIFKNIQFVISDEPIDNPTNELNNDELIMDTSEEDKELVIGSMSEDRPRDVPRAIYILNPETIVISEDEEVEEVKLPNELNQPASGPVINAPESPVSIISISDTEDVSNETDNGFGSESTRQVIGQVDLCDDTSSDEEYIVNLKPGPKSKTKFVRKRNRSSQNSKKNESSMKKTDFLQSEGQSISNSKSTMSPNNETNNLNEGNQVDAEVDKADEDSIEKNVFPKYDGQFSSSGESIMSPNNETNNLNEGNQVDTEVDMADKDSIEKNVFKKSEVQSNSSSKSILSPNNETNNLNEGNKVDSEIDTAVNSITNFEEVQSSLNSESIVLPNEETNVDKEEN